MRLWNQREKIKLSPCNYTVYQKQLSIFKNIIRLFNTIRYLQWRQIRGQIIVRLKKHFENPDKFFKCEIPIFEGCGWQLKKDFLAPGSQNNRQADLIKGNWTFLNDTRHLGYPPELKCDELPKLWQYNLHYFEYLWALDYNQAKALTLNWIAEHPLAQNRIGWDPYPISLRLTNWCCVLFGKFSVETDADKEFCELLWKSVYLQTEWLLQHIETHILGNHLFENAVCLVFTGSCFTGKSAEKWYQIGLNILEEELTEQILKDGMHFERSPMYHSRIVYVLCLLMNIQDTRLEQLLSEPLRKMISALDNLIHPDENIALFNDSAFGIYNDPVCLISYSNDLLGVSSSEPEQDSITTFSLPDAGYYGVRNCDGTFLICDAGEIGHDYIPGHAHADIFSFELSLKGHRVIVDSGVFDYNNSAMRKYCRSTRAHNTVEINDKDQCEMWGSFRVARRGKPFDINWNADDNGSFKLSGKHDGYRRLRGNPIHYRQFLWSIPDNLKIVDTILSSVSQKAISRIHLHPDCLVEELKDSYTSIKFPAGRLNISYLGKGILSVNKSFYCPEFGVKLSNSVLEFSSFGNEIVTEFQIEYI